MHIIDSSKVEPTKLNGRHIRKIIEKGGVVESQYMSLGMAEFSTDIGPMTPHRHDEEGIYVLEAENCYTRCGDCVENFFEPKKIEPGMFLLYGKDEWHVFEFQGKGYLKIIFFFATGDLKRPE